MRAHVTNVPGWHHYQRRSDGDRVIGQNTIHGRLPPFRSFRFPRNSRYDIGPLETGRAYTHTHTHTHTRVRVEYIRERVASTSFQSICDDTPMGRHSYRSGTQTRDERHATVISSPSADLITLPSISEYLDVNFDHDLHCLLFDCSKRPAPYYICQRRSNCIVRLWFRIYLSVKERWRNLKKAVYLTRCVLHTHAYTRACVCLGLQSVI